MLEAARRRRAEMLNAPMPSCSVCHEQMFARYTFVLPTGEPAKPVCPRCNQATKHTANHEGHSGVSERHRQIRYFAQLFSPLGDIRKFDAAVEAVRRFVEQQTSILALVGNHGTGKTQLASCAVMFIIDASYPASIRSKVELMADYEQRCGGNRKSDGKIKWLKKWAFPRLLAIDEFQRRVVTEKSEGMIEELLDQRYKAMRPTILVANVSRDEFIALAGSATTSRCSEGGGIIVCDWPSFRQ